MIMVPKDIAPPDVAGFDPDATKGACEFNGDAAKKAVRFFEAGLTHTKGKWAGQRFTLEPWQDAFIRTLFGWQRKDGTRRFRTAFLFIPRKNGKSQLAAAIANFVLLCDGDICRQQHGQEDDGRLQLHPQPPLLHPRDSISAIRPGSPHHQCPFYPAKDYE